MKQRLETEMGKRQQQFRRQFLRVAVSRRCDGSLSWGLQSWQQRMSDMTAASNHMRLQVANTEQQGQWAQQCLKMVFAQRFNASRTSILQRWHRQVAEIAAVAGLEKLSRCLIEGLLNEIKHFGGLLMRTQSSVAPSWYMRHHILARSNEGAQITTHSIG